MQAENLYNGPEVAGCRFSFWIPLVSPGDPNASGTPEPTRQIPASPPV